MIVGGVLSSGPPFNPPLTAQVTNRALISHKLRIENIRMYRQTTPKRVYLSLMRAALPRRSRK